MVQIIMNLFLKNDSIQRSNERKLIFKTITYTKKMEISLNFIELNKMIDCLA
jgi:hypothetical protein